MNRKYKKPLNLIISGGCVMFILFLCAAFGITNHIEYRSTLYKSYEKYITDILMYTKKNLDHDELARCTETLEESEGYLAMRDFMDREMESLDLHYLYIVKPLNTNKTQNMMSVISAEKYYDRYVDTDGNLWLGWVSDDEFDSSVAKMFFKVMDSDKVMFFEETTEWSTDYTGAVALHDSSGKAYAVLAVDVDISTIKHDLYSHTIRSILLITFPGAAFIALFLLWSRKNLTQPIKRLEESVSRFAATSAKRRSTEELVFDDPCIHTGNEIESLSDAVTKMTENIKEYVSDIVSAEETARGQRERADKMTEIANLDTLTGVRSRTAYDHDMRLLGARLGTEIDRLGIAVIDLNYLKVINDTYGHDRGNIAIKTLCGMICGVFSLSPVYRIGGDEFAVILNDSDYDNIEALTAEFNSRLEALSDSDSSEPWKCVSAAIGCAKYNKEIDADIQSVFNRADMAMYARKKQMKANRE